VSGQHGQPFVARSAPEGALENGRERLAMVQAEQPGAEAWIVGEGVQPEGRAQLHPERLVATGEEEPAAVRSFVEKIGGIVPKHRLPTGIVDHVAGLQGEGGRQQRGLHPLSVAGALADEQGGQDGLGSQAGRVVVGDGDTHILRWAAGALKSHHPLMA
jgi:hypothetical protein